jgi:hypothetical protein
MRCRARLRRGGGSDGTRSRPTWSGSRRELARLPPFRGGHVGRTTGVSRTAPPSSSSPTRERAADPAAHGTVEDRASARALLQRMAASAGRGCIHSRRASAHSGAASRAYRLAADGWFVAARQTIEYSVNASTGRAHTRGRGAPFSAANFESRRCNRVVARDPGAEALGICPFGAALAGARAQLVSKISSISA